MSRKISSIWVVILLIFSVLSFFTIYVDAFENNPEWPSSWILIESDPVENMEKDFRDVKNAYYNMDNSYLYFRLECYGIPDFISHFDECRYKWFIDVDDPHDMVWSGGNVVKADYMFFVEDTDNDGIGDVYFLDDVDGDGSFSEWEPPNNWYDRLITDIDIANYTIVGNNIFLWIKLDFFSNPDYVYFTWSTDQENFNINQAPSLDRSDVFSADLSKADLGIVKYGDKDPIAAGEILCYTIIVTNHGPHMAWDVNIFDTLPIEVFFNSAIPSPSQIDGSVYSWFFDSLGVGESETIIVNVTVDNSYTGVLNNTVSVDSVTCDLVPGNNIYIEQTNVIFIADLSIDKSADVETVYPGGVIEYTIIVTNHGPNIALGVNVTDILSDKVFFNNCSPNYNGFSDSTFWWFFDSLGVGESKIILVNVTVKNDAIGVIVNHVSVISDTFDPNPGDDSNTDDENTTIIQVADLGIIKTCDKNQVKIGENLNYVLNVINYGPCSAIDVNITDILPVDVDYVSAAPSPSGNNDNTFWWIVPFLDVDASYIIMINLTVNNYASDEIVNTGYVSFDGDDLITDNNEDTIETTVVIPSDDGSNGGSHSGSRAIFSVNKKPTADADGPYYGFIELEIVFDGTGSRDNDENGESIVRYDWKFFEEDIWHNNVGAIPTYIYNSAGVYNVTLRVYDDEGSSDINTTLAFISKPNYPPENLMVDGVKQGYIDINYIFNISAVDQDGDNLSYIVSWGDGTSNTSDILLNGTIYKVGHIWTVPGFYNITFTAVDELNTPSKTTFDIQIFSPPKDDKKEGNLLWYLLFLILLIIILLGIFYYIKTRRKEEPKTPVK